MTKPTAIRAANARPIPYGINFFLYSDPGVGKTPFIADRPKTLIIDADLGAESAVGTPADIWPATTWADIDETYEYLRHEDHGYEWVWFDGIGVGQLRLLTDIMEELHSRKPHRKVWAADQGEYQENMVRLKQYIQKMCKLPINFGVTSHPWRYQDAVTGDEMIMPWIQGKQMPQTICGMMNVIGFLTMDEDGQRLLYTKPRHGYYARDRFKALGPGMKNPTIPKIEAKIMAKVKEVTEANKSKAVPATKATTPVARRAAATGRK